MLEFYQNIPLKIDPVALSVGSFSIRWYSLMYLVGFFVFYLLLKYRISKKEVYSISSFLSKKSNLIDLLIYLSVGVLAGGRLGYVVFYEPLYYLKNPLEIISPFSAGGQFIGFYGMSYFGAVVGVVLAGLFYVKKYRISLLSLTDLVIPAVPLAYFFGRIGNFLNGELYGKETALPIGMYFSQNHESLRHPSQLYEALIEGLFIFAIIWPLRNSKCLKKSFLAIYLMSYSFVRFFLEFFRQIPPREEFLGLLSKGQAYSISIFLISFCLFIYLNKCVKINKKNLNILSF